MSGTCRRVTLSDHVIDAIWPSLRLFGLALLLGRMLLAFLPPGEPGGHTLRKLPVTLAASLLLGSGLLLALSFVSDQLWTLAAVVGAAGWLVRYATSPAGIVPRHELKHERGSWLSRLLFLGALVPAFLHWPPAAVDPQDATEILSLELLHRLALVVLVVSVEHGLATARRAPLGRSVFVLVLSLYLFRENANPASMSELVERISAACFGSGAAFALAWLRRADRRSAALAIACFVLARPWDALDGVILAGAALLALVLCTAGPARTWIATASGIGLALCIAPALRGMAWVGPPETGSPLQSLLRLALVLATLASVAWIARSIAVRWRAEPAEWRDTLARGDRFLLLLLVLGTIVCWELPAAAGILEGISGLQLVAPVAFLLAGCVSIRPERAP